jgi:hypothetical protein
MKHIIIIMLIIIYFTTQLHSGIQARETDESIAVAHESLTNCTPLLRPSLSSYIIGMIPIISNGDGGGSSKAKGDGGWIFQISSR